MTELLAAWGPLGLFTAALLAGSIVPAPSEAVLVLLVRQGLDAVLLVALASVGNVAGAGSLLWLGRQGRAAAERRTNPARLLRFERWCRRAGPFPLLLSWLPFLGDALVLAAGVARLRVSTALACIAVGKVVRYAVVAALASSH